MAHRQVTIIDVAPRDGLQNESTMLPPAIRAELVERLLKAGLPRVEVGSFVNPRQVPLMAGTDEVVAALLAPATARGRPMAIEGFTALIPNIRGYELAARAGLRHVRFVLAASESLNQANFKRPVEQSLAELAEIARLAEARNIRLGVGIAASFGCPYEGYVAPSRVLRLARSLAGLGVDEVVLADTTGMAVPTQVAELCRATLGLLDGGPTVTAHFHNTRNSGYANAFAAWQAGVTSFDASLGGIGGCPFAPCAVGNIASEDLVHMFNGMGVDTGIDLAGLLDASRWLSRQLAKTLPAMLGRAEPVHRQPAETAQIGA